MRALLFAALAASASAQEPKAYRCLAAAYPESVRGFHDGSVLLSDGTKLPWSDGRLKTADQRIDDPDLADMFAVAYPAGAGEGVPADDPGRARVTALFEALYGKKPPLEEVAWFGHKLPFNGRQGAAAALRRVASDLEKLPAPLRKFFTVTSGTYNPRNIAGTNRPSAHSWAIAIDLDTANSDYWRWSGAYRNRIPLAIVRVFERHGFIWGGRWRHFDTMHFEYRPELLCKREVTK
jgi:hypothetical protein